MFGSEIWLRRTLRLLIIFVIYRDKSAKFCSFMYSLLTTENAIKLVNFVVRIAQGVSLRDNYIVKKIIFLSFGAVNPCTPLNRSRWNLIGRLRSAPPCKISSWSVHCSVAQPKTDMWVKCTTSAFQCHSPGGDNEYDRCRHHNAHDFIRWNYYAVCALNWINITVVNTCSRSFKQQKLF